MRKLLMSLLTVSLFLGGSGSSMLAADQSARALLDDRAREVNRSAKEQGMPLTLKRISTETGVPLEQVQSMHKRHSDIGPAGLLIACVLANDTKKEPEVFMKRRASGKTWTSIAKENKVSLEKLNARLDRLDTAIGEDNSKDRDTRKNKSR
ncbi:MAG: hypothetical protein H7Y43_09595 [Akkermansiaceae bacterium]|nr:hypothetical protein [Verrucomicrobiales bacterium]